jgi:hypothetical protein
VIRLVGACSPNSTTSGPKALGLEILAKSRPTKINNDKSRKRGHDTSSTHRLECQHGSHGDVFIHHYPGLGPALRCPSSRRHTWVTCSSVEAGGRLLRDVVYRSTATV